MELGTALVGWVTENNFGEAEEVFPGIEVFFHSIPEQERPRTFLELVWRFEATQPVAQVAY